MLAVLIGVFVIPIYVGPRSPDTLLLGALLMGACGMGVFGIVRPISPNGFRPPLVVWAWVCLPRRRSSRIGYAGIYRCASGSRYQASRRYGRLHSRFRCIGCWHDLAGPGNAGSTLHAIGVKPTHHI